MADPPGLPDTPSHTSTCTVHELAGSGLPLASRHTGQASGEVGRPEPEPPLPPPPPPPPLPPPPPVPMTVTRSLLAVATVVVQLAAISDAVTVLVGVWQAATASGESRVKLTRMWDRMGPSWSVRRARNRCAARCALDASGNRAGSRGRRPGQV